MWVLIFICLNGAQGCTYSAPPNIRIGAPSCDYECVVAYKTRAACQQDADAFKAATASTAENSWTRTPRPRPHGIA